MSDFCVPLANEWSFLLAACSEFPAEEKAARISELSRSGVRWKLLFSLAEHHGVQPILAQCLMSVGEHVPVEALDTVKKLYHANLHKALLLSRELARIVDCLSQARIEFIPYKGLALAETVYGDAALRQSGDIDLLIHPADLRRVREAVAGLGYAPHQQLSDDEEQAYLRSGYECAFDGPMGKNLLEVQWAIQPRFYAVDVDMERLFLRSVTVTVVGAEVKTLSPEDSFLILALHAAKHVWGKLIWLCDLARISRSSRLDWKWIGDQAKDLGIARILLVTLALARDLLGASFLASALEHLPGDAAIDPLAKEIAAYIASEESFDVESPAYFKLMMRLRERRRDRMRFVSRLAFTPGPSEWALVRLPRSLFPLYRVVRITRLAARLVSRRARAG